MHNFKVPSGAVGYAATMTTSTGRAFGVAPKRNPASSMESGESGLPGFPRSVRESMYVQQRNLSSSYAVQKARSGS